MNSIFIRTLISFTKFDKQQKQILATLLNELIIAMSNGHSCLSLEDYLLSKNNEHNLSLYMLVEILEKSNICDFYRNEEKHYSKPLILIQINNVSKMLYFNRYYQYEKNIAMKIKDLVALSNINLYDIESEIIKLQLNLPNNLPNKNQIEAIKESAKNKFSIITGGPGTGKTTTIFILIIILLRLYKTTLKIAIIAPTGKAVLRANQSVLNSLNSFANHININDDEKDILNDIQYKTIHKLLGYMNLSNSFKYNKENNVDYDIIIVDESSMVSLTLYNNLLMAINEKSIKHLIFLGDKNQLSSVEEGHVFSDLIKYHLLNNNLFQNLNTNISVSFLAESNRNDEDIAILALAILNENINQLEQIIDTSDRIYLKNCDLAILMTDLFTKDCFLANYVELIKQKKDVEDLFFCLSQFSILCNKNVGIMGTDNINNIIDSLIRDLLDYQNTWYPGRTIIILENNQGLGLVNGDIGVCIIDSDGCYKIAFNNGKILSLQLLPRFSLAYAITIHKAQGSEYKQVLVVLDDYSNSMLSKELIYTAITRAKNFVNIYVERNLLLKSIQRNVVRYSGLYYFLQE